MCIPHCTILIFFTNIIHVYTSANNLSISRESLDYIIDKAIHIILVINLILDISLTGYQSQIGDFS